MAYVYMVRCENGSLYTGWTNDLEKRLAAHQSGHGAAYTRGFGAASLAYAQCLPDKSAALRREAELKKLTKQEKETLAAGFDPARFVILRPAVTTDAEAVRSIVDPYVLHSTASFLYQTPSLQQYRSEIRAISRRLPYLLATDALGKPLGYACAHPWRYGDFAYAWDVETTIYLAPDARRLGLGRMLYQALLAQLALQGYWNAYAVLADPNPDSEAFHQAMGFVCEGRQKRTGFKKGWQGVSYWAVRLHEGEEEPQTVPCVLTRQQKLAVLEQARLGADWRSIAAKLSCPEEKA